LTFINFYILKLFKDKLLFDTRMISFILLVFVKHMSQYKVTRHY